VGATIERSIPHIVSKVGSVELPPTWRGGGVHPEQTTTNKELGSSNLSAALHLIRTEDALLQVPLNKLLSLWPMDAFRNIFICILFFGLVWVFFWVLKHLTGNISFLFAYITRKAINHGSVKKKGWHFQFSREANVRIRFARRRRSLNV